MRQVNLFSGSKCVWCGRPVGGFHILVVSGSRRFRLCGQVCLLGWCSAPPP
jgi:hypothetical protein